MVITHTEKDAIMNQEEKIRLARTPPGWMYEFDLGDGIITLFSV